MVNQGKCKKIDHKLILNLAQQCGIFYILDTLGELCKDPLYNFKLIFMMKRHNNSFVPLLSKFFMTKIFTKNYILDPISIFHLQMTMVACIFYIVASMAMVAHGLPHTDHDNGFVLDQRFQANLGKCKRVAQESTAILKRADH